MPLHSPPLCQCPPLLRPPPLSQALEDLYTHYDTTVREDAGRGVGPSVTAGGARQGREGGLPYFQFMLHLLSVNVFLCAP